MNLKTSTHASLTAGHAARTMAFIMFALTTFDLALTRLRRRSCHAAGRLTLSRKR